MDHDDAPATQRDRINGVLAVIRRFVDKRFRDYHLCIADNEDVFQEFCLLLRKTYGEDCLHIIAARCLDHGVYLGHELAILFEKARYEALGKERGRARRSQRAVSIDQTDYEVASADNWVETIETAIDIKHAIDQLKPIDRQVCRMLADGQSLPEIGKKLGLTYKQAKSSKRRVFYELDRKLESYRPDDGR